MTAGSIERINVFRAVWRAKRPARRAAFSLALPLIVFLAIVFIAPILYLLVTAVRNPEVRQVLPRTLVALNSWDGTSTPAEPVYAALAADLKVANDESTAALLGKRLNYEIPGMRSRVLAAARMVDKLDTGPYKKKFLKLSEDWGAPNVWAVIQRNGSTFTPYYLLTALDLKQNSNGSVSRVAHDQAVFVGAHDSLGRSVAIQRRDQ